MSTLTVRADADPTTHDDAAPANSFWRRPIVQDVLPFCSSLALHLAIIAIGILTYKAAQIMITPSDTPLVIPDLADAPDAELALPKSIQGIDPQATLPPMQDVDPTANPNSKGLSDKAAVVLARMESGGGRGSDNNTEIALGLNRDFGHDGHGNGIGTNDGTGFGGIGGLGLAPWGQKSLAADVIFKGNAKKIVFLCDSSGSMVSKFDALRTELRKAVDALRPNQQFDVVFFSEDRFIALDASLLYALPEKERRAFDFLDGIAAHSSSDPIPGLRAAFKTNPELIFMLTDGDFPNNEAVQSEIRKLRANNTNVKINTIAFMDRGESYEKLLSDIARETGGLFRFVSEKDLEAKP